VIKSREKRAKDRESVDNVQSQVHVIDDYKKLTDYKKIQCTTKKKRLQKIHKKRLQKRHYKKIAYKKIHYKKNTLQKKTTKK
jgi:hypothetical protein